MDLGLRDKVALITGGSRGIGRAIAHALAREGCHLMLTARTKMGLDTVAAQLASSGVTVGTVAIDVASPEAAQAIVEATVARFGCLDILVANAGGMVGPPAFADAGPEAWIGTFQLNVVHAVELLRQAVPHLEKSGEGVATFIASISGRVAVESGAPYAAAKAALIQAARSLAWELGPQRIRVNAVSPGSTLFEGGGWERRRREMPDVFGAFERDEFPWGRLGTAEEIADAVAFVSSPKASWINGADIPVDGSQRRPSLPARRAGSS
jgi:3-oxoacyl-[acyl-carrier protein] reductase